MQRHGFLTATAVGIASPAGRSDGTDTLGGGLPPSYRTNIPVRSATGGGSTFAHVGIPRLLEVDTLDSETDTPPSAPPQCGRSRVLGTDGAVYRAGPEGRYSGV